jgi:hypothetical protein
VSPRSISRSDIYKNQLLLTLGNYSIYICYCHYAGVFSNATNVELMGTAAAYAVVLVVFLGDTLSSN